MKWNSAVAIALLAPSNVYALLRFPCAQLVIDRIDPLVNPGQAPSPHLHQLIGGVSLESVLPVQRNELIFIELIEHHHGPQQGYARRVHLHVLPI